MDALTGDGAPRRFCANADYDVCNWLIPAGSPDRLCLACRHNDTIPGFLEPRMSPRGGTSNSSKHRLFYSLLRWRLPLETRAEDPAHGLAFEFLADPPHPAGQKVMTGHEDGVVTIALAEANRPRSSSAGRNSPRLIAGCSAISATRSDTITGT